MVFSSVLLLAIFLFFNNTTASNSTDTGDRFKSLTDNIVNLIEDSLKSDCKNSNDSLSSFIIDYVSILENDIDLYATDQYVRDIDKFLTKLNVFGFNTKMVEIKTKCSKKITDIREKIETAIQALQTSFKTWFQNRKFYGKVKQYVTACNDNKMGINWLLSEYNKFLGFHLNDGSSTKKLNYQSDKIFFLKISFYISLAQISSFAASCRQVVDFYQKNYQHMRIGFTELSLKEYADESTQIIEHLLTTVVMEKFINDKELGLQNAITQSLLLDNLNEMEKYLNETYAYWRWEVIKYPSYIRGWEKHTNIYSKKFECGGYHTYNHQGYNYFISYTPKETFENNDFQLEKAIQILNNIDGPTNDFREFYERAVKYDKQFMKDLFCFMSAIDISKYDENQKELECNFTKYFPSKVINVQQFNTNYGARNAPIIEKKTCITLGFSASTTKTNKLANSKQLVKSNIKLFYLIDRDL